MTDGRIGQPLAEEALTQAPPARSSRLTGSPAWVVESEERFTIPIYHRRGLVLVRGSGARVWDAEGRSYIDCVAGHGVALVGHCNPYVVEAVRRQCEDLITCPCSFYNATRAAFLEEMAEILPAGLRRFFLCNSGTEAVEAAIKFARASTGRTQVVAARRGFHGRTLGALSATWQPKY
ncbi:MAG: aminotransferase class III-fold pyridoxal phosphate-dependent enzyme, partial [Firmicutes bacterium]|nr:aminotransferase class III-fold pyridoxal phosphate-dependent enzyme [Bacillota bacterium]